MIEETEQQVLDLWTAFDLTSRKIGLDKQLMELRETKGAAVEVFTFTLFSTSQLKVIITFLC